MEIPFITTITLIWLAYTFLFTEADKQILDLFNRLKVSLSINNQGAIEKTQLEVKMLFGVPEIISLGQTFNEEDVHRKNIETFASKVRKISLAKNFLIANLFLLTAHPFFCFFTGIFTVDLHVILSLIFGACFYWYIQQLPNLKFTQILPMSNA